MPSRRSHPIHRLGITGRRTSAAWALAVGLPVSACGCSGFHREATPSPRTEVVTEGGLGDLSTEARREQFQAAFAQGLYCAGRGEYAPALGAFERAAKLEPNSAEALFNLGACYEAVGDPLRAMDFYRRVLAVRPNDADCYRNLGTSFIKMYQQERSPGWKQMARNAWERSLELRPNQADVHRFLALAATESE